MFRHRPSSDSVLVIVTISLICFTICSDAETWRTETGEEIPIPTSSSARDYVTNQVICHTFDVVFDIPQPRKFVEVRDLVGDRQFRDAISNIGITRVRRLFTADDDPEFDRGDGSLPETVQLENVLVFEFSKTRSIDDVIRGLQELPQVMLVERNVVLSFPDTPTQWRANDPDWDDQWNLMDPDFDDDWGIGCPTAWDSLGYCSPDIRVGVVEKHADRDHVDFALNDTSYVEGLVWISTGIGDEGIWSTNPAYWSADDLHGNPVVGVIGARSFNEVGIHGIAGGYGDDEKGATVVVLAMTSGVSVHVDDFADLIEIGSEPTASGGGGCEVISVSSGGGGSEDDHGYFETVRKAVLAVYANECNFISGKGESGDTIPEYVFHFPGDYDYSRVTCVGGYDDDGTLCINDCGNYTTYGGKGLDLLAPAEVFPAVLLNDTTGSFLGVSGGVPHVNGSMALLRSSSVCSGANLRPEDYEGILKRTACVPGSQQDCEDNPDWDQDWGYGILQIGRAAEHVTQTGHVFRQYSASGGSVCDSLFTAPLWAEYRFQSSSFKGTYYAQVLKVRVSVSYTDSFDGVPSVWALQTGVLGISAANPNYCLPYCVVEDGSMDEYGCDMFTYVMRLYDSNGTFVRWYPCKPDDAVARCRVSGVLDSKIQHSEPVSRPHSTAANESDLWFNSDIDADATMTVYSIAGRVVAKNIPLRVVAGQNRVAWNGNDNSGRRVASGIYLVKIDTPGRVWNKKVLVVK